MIMMIEASCFPAFRPRVLFFLTIEPTAKADDRPSDRRDGKRERKLHLGRAHTERAVREKEAEKLSG